MRHTCSTEPRARPHACSASAPTRPAARPTPESSPPGAPRTAHRAPADDAPVHRSVRNSFPGIITAVELGDVAALVEFRADPTGRFSQPTREAVEEMGLDVGMRATGRVKSTSAHVDLA